MAIPTFFALIVSIIRIPYLPLQPRRGAVSKISNVIINFKKHRVGRLPIICIDYGLTASTPSQRNCHIFWQFEFPREFLLCSVRYICQE